MSKNVRGQKEYSRLQEALHENKKLKREISSLRKQLARVSLDSHSYVNNIIDESPPGADQESAEKLLQRLKEEWKCRGCPEGYLEINLYSRMGETWYFRKCNFCTNRTTSKQYFSDKVDGPLKQIKPTS